MKEFYFLVRWGNWILSSRGLLRYRWHQNKSGQVRWQSWQ